MANEKLDRLGAHRTYRHIRDDLVSKLPPTHKIVNNQFDVLGQGPMDRNNLVPGDQRKLKHQFPEALFLSAEFLRLYRSL